MTIMFAQQQNMVTVGGVRVGRGATDTVCRAPPGMNEVTANYSLSDYNMMVSTRIFSNSMARTIAALQTSV